MKYFNLEIIALVHKFLLVVYETPIIRAEKYTIIK
jgi:hypothetical protein